MNSNGTYSGVSYGMAGNRPVEGANPLDSSAEKGMNNKNGSSSGGNQSIHSSALNNGEHFANQGANGI